MKCRPVPAAVMFLMLGACSEPSEIVGPEEMSQPQYAFGAAPAFTPVITLNSGVDADTDNRDDVITFGVGALSAATEAAYVIPGHPEWAPPIPGTAYIGANATSQQNAPDNTFWTFHASFTLPDTYGNPVMQIQVHADNAATIYLNGNNIGGHEFNIFANQNFQGAPETWYADNTTDNHFQPGVNVVQVVLENSDNFGNPNPAGLNFQLTVGYDCLAGSWFDGTCKLADPGYFVPGDGAVEQLPCPVGTYQPDPGAESCIPADIGYFVADQGQLAQTKCALGFTTHVTGSSFCIANSPPVINTLADLPIEPIPVGTSAMVRVLFSDPDPADAASTTATVDWGDGTTSDCGNLVLLNGSGECSGGSHTYLAPGVYTVTATVDDGNTGTSSLSYQYVVVYDPNGGFVTGSGWVEVPAGSYLADPSASGPARFGFQARYRTGQKTVPEGGTQFHFRAAGMEFRSTAYDWLVVAGARAQYKGEGTINGVTGYCFLLTGVDSAVSGGGDVDRLRLKVSMCADDAIVFDNLLGAADDTEPTAISRGNVVIHR